MRQLFRGRLYMFVKWHFLYYTGKHQELQA
jgi:hypothetical protein